MRWTEDVVIESGIEQYRKCGAGAFGSATRVDKLPDHRNFPEIDAVADAPGKPSLAIEHTQLESFAGQLFDDTRIDQLCVTLASEIRARLPLGLSCILPVRAFVKGFDWQRARNHLGVYIEREAAGLPEGYSSHAPVEVPFPFKLHLDKASNTPFLFMRSSPARTVLRQELVATMEKALDHKRDRLGWYRKAGYRTSLLLESSDTPLINHVDAYKAYLIAEKFCSAEHANDILFGQTGTRPEVEWLCFKTTNADLLPMNPPHFMLGPEFHEYWWSVINQEAI